MAWNECMYEDEKEMCRLAKSAGMRDNNPRGVSCIGLLRSEDYKIQRKNLLNFLGWKLEQMWENWIWKNKKIPVTKLIRRFFIFQSFAFVFVQTLIKKKFRWFFAGLYKPTVEAVRRHFLPVSHIFISCPHNVLWWCKSMESPYQTPYPT